MDLDHPPHLASVEALLQLAYRRVEALDMADGEHLALLSRRGDQLLSLFQIGCDRLLHQHVQAMLDGGEADLQVMPGRHGDDDGVQPALVEELPVGAIADQPPLLRPGHSLVRGVAYGNQVGLVDVVQDTGVAAAHHSEADDPHPDHYSGSSRTTG